ncbi:hypothetical protein ACVNF4_02315 [Streptomyces sp. S6]
MTSTTPPETAWRTPTSPVVRTLRTVRTDLRYQWASRYLLYTLVCFAAVASVFAFGAYSTARGAVDSLWREWAYLRGEGGYTFDRAIGRGGDPTDDPLRDTWEHAGQALAGLQPFQGAVNLLQVLCFVVAPLVFFAYGAIAATRDTHHKTLKFRAVREGPGRLFASQALTLTAVTTALTAAAFAVTLLTSTALYLTAYDRVDARRMEIPADLSPWSALPTLGMLLLTSLLFAFLGMSTALLAGRPLPVLPPFFAAFLLLPVLGPYDPRNLLMAIAHPHLDFVGSFQPPTPHPVPEPLAALLLTTATAALLTAAHVVRARRSLYTA